MANIEKKRLLIAMDTMMCGGIEKSAVSLLSALPPERYDVTLMLLTRTGEFLEMIPPWVRVVEVPLAPAGRSEWVRGRHAVLQEALRRGALVQATELILRQIACRLFVSRDRWSVVHFRAMLRGMRLDGTEYDCAMAYHNIEQAVLVAERVRAKRKMTWFHTELSKLPVSPRASISVHRSFDVLAAASEAVADELKRFFPEFASRVRRFPYITDGDLYAELARQGRGFDDAFDGVRILSVGRLAHQKGFDIAVAVHARLIADGYRVRWYVAGQGYEEASLRELIETHGVAESFRLLGVQQNPYPYFSQCDLYVQPSRYEGYCLTVAEARAFAKPIVCTDFAGAREQICDGETGLVTSCEESAIYAAVKALLDNPELRRTFSINLARSRVDTTRQITRLCAVMDGEEPAA